MLERKNIEKVPLSQDTKIIPDRIKSLQAILDADVYEEISAK